MLYTLQKLVAFLVDSIQSLLTCLPFVMCTARVRLFVTMRIDMKRGKSGGKTRWLAGSFVCNITIGVKSTS